MTWSKMDRGLLLRYLEEKLESGQTRIQINRTIATIPEKQGEFNLRRNLVPVTNNQNLKTDTLEVVPRTVEDRWSFYLSVSYEPDCSQKWIKEYLDSILDDDAQSILKSFLRARLSGSDKNLRLRLGGPVDSGKSMLIRLIEFLFQKFAHRLECPSRQSPSCVDYRDTRQIFTSQYPYRCVRLFTMEVDQTLEDNVYRPTPLLVYGNLSKADIETQCRFIRNRNFYRELCTNDHRQEFFNWIFS